MTCAALISSVRFKLIIDHSRSIRSYLRGVFYLWMIVMLTGCGVRPMMSHERPKVERAISEGEGN